MVSLASESPRLLATKILVAVESVTLGAMLVATWILAERPDWATPAPVLGTGWLATSLVVASALLISVALRSRLALTGAAAAAVVFCVVTALELRATAEVFVLGTSRFVDAYYMVVGFHCLHVAAAGLLALRLTFDMSDQRNERVAALAFAWRAMALAWLPVAATFYWTGASG